MPVLIWKGVVLMGSLFLGERVVTAVGNSIEKPVNAISRLAIISGVIGAGFVAARYFKVIK